MGLFSFMKKKEELPELPPLPDLGSEPAKNPFPSGVEPPPFSDVQQPLPPSSSWAEHPTASIYPSAPGTPASANFNPPPFGREQSPPPFNPQQGPPPGPDAKDVQIIIAKLDAIRAEMDSMNQRIIKIEKIAEGSLDKKAEPRYRW